MTHDEIIEMAREAHRKLVTEVYVGHMGKLDTWTIELLKIFANLVAAKEREACAKFFDDNDTNIFWGSEAARFIRARGEQA